MDIDWEEQWALFAKGYREGKAHIDVGADKPLLLLPGPGFGDLSHPTTNLMLELLCPCVKGKTVLDIGTGSGILALASLIKGACFAYGIDIEEAALDHARQNALLNGLEKRSRFSRTLPKQPSKSIVLLNMILSEQRQVVEQIPELASVADLWITSGILATQKIEALAFLNTLGLRVLEERQEGEWLGWKCST